MRVALFRDFLLAKAQEEYTRAGLRRLLEETAQLLETIEQDEDAISLYRGAEDWSAVTRLLLKQAPRLLRLSIVRRVSLAPFSIAFILRSGLA